MSAIEIKKLETDEGVRLERSEFIRVGILQARRIDSSWYRTITNEVHVGRSDHHGVTCDRRRVKNLRTQDSSRE